jgi:C1A family cysteine protease
MTDENINNPPYIKSDSPRTVGKGWIPDAPDYRDHMFSAQPAIVGDLPISIDLRQQFPSLPYSQLQMSSCTANAIAGAIQFDQAKQGLPIVMPSRLFIYYNEREMENSVDSDCGAMIRDGIKSVATQGYCSEDMWPYDTSKFRMKPTPDCYDYGSGHIALQYMRLNQSLLEMRACLAAGYPFIFGFTVYDSFEGSEVAKTGILEMPRSGENVQGGHAVLACGFNDDWQRFIVRNSWGTDWGQGGFFTIPYSYLSEPYLSSDFWTLRTLSD